MQEERRGRERVEVFLLNDEGLHAFPVWVFGDDPELLYCLVGNLTPEGAQLLVPRKRELPEAGFTLDILPLPEFDFAGCRLPAERVYLEDGDAPTHLRLGCRFGAAAAAQAAQLRQLSERLAEHPDADRDIHLRAAIRQ